MRRLVACMATLMCGTWLMAAGVGPAAADTISVGDGGWSASLTFPDMQWTSTSCQFLPVTAVVSGSTVESWTFGGIVSNVASDPDEDDGPVGFAWFIDYDDQIRSGPGTFTIRHAVLLCPGIDGSGRYEVVGEIGAKLAGAADWAWLPYAATFTVNEIATATTLDSIAVVGGEALFAGGVQASGPPSQFRGCRDGYVNVESMQGGDWEEVWGSSLGTDGSYVISVPTYRLTGDTYRVRYGGGSICGESASEARALPVRLPRIKVTVLGKQSRFKVDVDPNRGRKSWTFRVQRSTDDGETWRTVRTYRTQGSRETRTINLGKGNYRIHMKAQAGYAETYSDSFYLER